MGWQIDLFRVLPGQDPCKVRDVQYDWAEHAGYEVGKPRAESDEWVAHVLELLKATEPAFEEVGERTMVDGGHLMHVGLVQPAGSCVVNVYPDAVDVRGKWGYADRYDGELFEHLWHCCRLLAVETAVPCSPNSTTNRPTCRSTSRSLAPSTSGLGSGAAGCFAGTHTSSRVRLVERDVQHLVVRVVHGEQRAGRHLGR